MRRLFLLSLLLCASFSAVAADSPPLVPDPAKTPGDGLTAGAKANRAPPRDFKGGRTAGLFDKGWSGQPGLAEGGSD